MIMLQMRRTIITGWCLILCTTMYAFRPGYRTVDIRDGLASMFVLTLHQDADGFIWAGTYNGVSLLGGNNSQVLFPDRHELESLSGTIVESIQSTEDGQFWIQNNFGLHMWNRRTGEMEHHIEAQGGNRCAVSPKGDVVAFSSRRGFLAYNAMKHYFDPLTIDTIPYGNYRYMRIDSLHHLTIYTITERLTYELHTAANDGAVSATLLRREAHAMGRILYARPSGQDFFYIDAEGRVLMADIEGLKPHYCFTMTPEQRERGDISAILRDGQDILISFYTGGIIRMKHRNDDSYEQAEQFFHNGVFDMLKDRRQDILWVASDGEGICYSVRNPHFIRNENFHDLPFPVTKSVRALILDSNGDLWLGTKGDGLICYQNYNPFEDRPRHVIQMTHQNSALLHNSVYCIVPGTHGIIWISSDGNGLNYYDPAKRTMGTLTVDDPDMAHIHSLLQLNEQELYVASNRGIYRVRLAWKGDTPTATEVKRIIYDKSRDLSNFISVTHQGNYLWFACRNNGMVRYDLRTGRYAICHIAANTMSASHDAICVDASRPGYIFLGTSAGAYQVEASPNSQKLAQINISEEVEQKGKCIRSLVATPSDTIWGSTSNTLFCMDIRTRTYNIYTTDNGLSTMEFGEGACYYDARTGVTYFGAIDGFVAISSRQYVSPPLTPPILFTSLRVGDQYFDTQSLAIAGKPLKLKYHQNYFTVGFTAIDYADANDYTFEYRLNDQPWNDNGHNRSISFVDMNPGSYTLQVRYKKGHYVSPIYTLHLRIMPPWWLSIPAIIFYILMAIAIISYQVALYRRRQRRRLRREAEEVEKRHREELYTSRLQFFIDLTRGFSTPLMLIEGPVQRILNFKPLNETIKHYAELIQENSHQMNQLIQRVIEFRSYETGRLLPTDPTADKAAAQLPQAPTNIDPSKPTVFMADENHEVLQLLNDILRADFNVFCFDTPENLLAKLSVQHPDVVVAECVMQPFGGIELCRRLKNDTATAHLPVVILSTDFAPQTRTESATAGADTFLTKPFDLDYFISLVKGLVQQRSQLKAYFNSSLSAFELHDGRLLHEEDRAFMDQMVAIITDNLEKPELSAAFIADEMGVGLRNLYRRMQEITTETPTALIRELRIERARQLLTKTELSMEEVCYRAGYTNRGTFYKQFATKFGCTPGQYHEKMMEEARRTGNPSEE